MGDALREKAFDAAFSIVGDVGEAEDCATKAIARAERRWGTVRHGPDREAWIVREAANVAMAKISRRGQHRRLVGLGLTVLVVLAAASGVAIAGNGGGARGTEQAVTRAPVPAPEDTTTAEAATTTTAVLMQPPLVTVAPPVPRPTTTTTTTSPALRTQTTSALTRTGLQPIATVALASPPSSDPRRVYVSARGHDDAGYVDRMSIDWGDGTPAMNFDYPFSGCEIGALQAVDTNHAYGSPRRYTVRLIVTSVSCDGKDTRTATAETAVDYSTPSSG